MQFCHLVVILEVISVIRSDGHILASSGVVENDRVVAIGIFSVARFAQHDLCTKSRLVQQWAYVIAQQIADLGVRNLGINTRLVKQAEIINKNAIFLVLLEISQVVTRQ